MKNTLILVLFPLFAIGVFGADELKSVSVKEGDSVTLNTGVQINGSNEVDWRLNGKLIFRISSSAGNISVSDFTDGAFRDRLKVDKPTGDLKITNFRNTDSGEYLLKIYSTRGSSNTTFSVTGVSNADRDPVKSVTEGESITLKTQIQSDEVKWRFRAENTLIAEINVTANRITVYDHVLDGRFRDRLKLNEDTGSLTITNIRDTHSGVYEAEISSVNRFTILRTFSVTVEGVKSVPVMEGDSFSLHTGVAKIQSGDVIEWRFGDRDVIIARLNGPDVNQTWSNMNLNKRTGDLNINNIKRNQSGYYKVQIDTINVISHRKYHINISGVSDRDSVKSVTEGESITLKTQKQSGDVIQWRFGAENTLIAEINLMADRITVYDDVLDGRFRDRLKLDDQTGSLTITNITDPDFGVYKADIIISSFTIHKTFSVAVRGVKSVSVMEGESVSLHTRLTEIQRDDVILWRFGDRDVIIARLNGPDVFNKWSNVNVNKQTGDLTINNIKRDQSGDYKVQIDTINVISHRKYHINIIESFPSQPVTYSVSPAIWIGIGIVIMFIMIGIKKVLLSFCSSRNKVKKQNRSKKEEETELSK